MIRKCVLLIAVSLLCGLPLVAGAQTDLSTPRSAAQSFAEAIQKGDTKAAQAAAVSSDPKQLKLVQLTAEVSAAMRQLHEAAAQQFAGTGEIWQGMKQELKLPSISLAPEPVIQGDTATITPATGAPVVLKKVGNEWKVDVSKFSKDIEADTAFLNGLSRLARDLTTDIQAGRFENVNLMRTALRNRIAALLHPGGPSTQPAATQAVNVDQGQADDDMDPTIILVPEEGEVPMLPDEK